MSNVAMRLRATRRAVMTGIAAIAAGLAAASPAMANDAEPVTAAAWAVSDAETGEILASKGLDEPSKIASLAMVMSALVIAELADAEPAILDEELTFSEEAVTRTGSKTGLKAGDRITVRDALYGLMLPSGNDAGFVLARHFSAKLGGDVATRGATAFLNRMNRKAKALGMANTRFRSSFGDGGTAEEKTSTPRDLLTLARAAMANPLVRKLAGARTHAAKVKDASGAERTVQWKNSNILLERSGFTGIKTGATKAAGSCMLTEVTVRGRAYHVIVLGSGNSTARFNDTLKLLVAVTSGKTPQ